MNLVDQNVVSRYLSVKRSFYILQPLGIARLDIQHRSPSYDSELILSDYPNSRNRWSLMGEEYLY